MIRDFLSPMFLQAACAKKQAGENIIRFKGEEADPMFGFACIGEVTIESVKNGESVTQTVPASEMYIASVQADANTYVTLRGDVVGIAFGQVNYEGQTYDLYKVTTLDTRKNKILMQIGCVSCKLTALDVSANTALTTLNCRSNQLTALDLSANTALTELVCVDNQLTALDLSVNTALTTLSCGSNQLTALDLSANTALTTLRCDYNQLTALNVSANTDLTTLYCFNNQLTALDLSANTALTELSCDSCAKLVSISYPATNEDVSTAIAGAITAANAADGTVYTDSTADYYSTIADAATAKGWTIEQL